MSSLLFGNQGTQTPKFISPFGNMGIGVAGGLENQFMHPLRQGFGFDPSQRFENKLQNAQGPLADIIRYVQGFEPGVAGQAQQIGQETAARGSQAYQTLTGQIDQYLQSLPQYQQQANLGAADATRAVQDAFSPVTSSALYGEASQRLLEQMRPGEAARGLESGGAAQSAEESGLRDLTFQFAQNQQQQEQQALQGLQGATGFANQMSGAGMQPASQLFGAAGEAQNLQSQAYQQPMQAIGQILQLLMGGSQSNQQFLQQVAPQMGSFGQQGKDFFGAHF